MSSKHGLGRGFDSLFGGIEDATLDDSAATKEILISRIFPNENQPRKNFDESALIELANSIRVHGVISPVIVVKRDDKYMLIAGERRWRAAQKAGLLSIPALVRDYTEKEVKEISLIENLQREDLNPIEVAYAIRQLMDDYDYTQEQVADRIGKSRPAVANTLRLLTLCKPVLDLVASKKLSEGHARCLVGISDDSEQYELAKKGISDKMTVRDFEKLIKHRKDKTKEKVRPPMSAEFKDLISRMQRVFSTKVSALGNDRRGRIYIDYFSRDDLDRILELIEKLEK